MMCGNLFLAFVMLLTSLLLCSVQAAEQVPRDLKPPVEEDIWIRPAPGGPAEPIIGFKDGIRIALWPTGGPRGLIRIYVPYVFPESKHQNLNFIAVEPVVPGCRSFSELEFSGLDGVQGMRMWFSDELGTSTPALPWNPARGKLGKLKLRDREIRTLSVVVNIERFANGTHPQVLVTFREDRPNEVGFKTYACEDSIPIESCVLTATMGNYSRTRYLWLKDEVLDSRKIWPDYKGSDFVWTGEIPKERIRREIDGTYTAAITPSEKDLKAVDMPSGGWVFNGKVSTQYWRKYPRTAQNDLRIRVNGRAMYWAGQTLIPGGVAFENFEFIEKFKPGLESWFGVTLKTPEEMGWKVP
jgi:hypothetical protein